MLKPLKRTISECVNNQPDKDCHTMNEICKKVIELENYDIFLERAERYVDSIGFAFLGLLNNYCD